MNSSFRSTAMPAMLEATDIRSSEGLFPLNEFYVRESRTPPTVNRLEGENVPQPYRNLLVHRNDMTPTLEAFHGEPIRLRLLDRRQDGDRLYREVALTLVESGVPVEFGAIVIHCDRFPPAAREEILGCSRPLGSILAVHGIDHFSRPQAFFEIISDEVMNAALRLDRPLRLYGRRNVLMDSEEQVLAEVVEILPPLQQ